MTLFEYECIVEELLNNALNDLTSKFEYECLVEELLNNALNDLTSKDFDNLLAYTLREYKEFFAIQKRACGNAIKAWNRRTKDE